MVFSGRQYCLGHEPSWTMREALTAHLTESVKCEGFRTYILRTADGTLINIMWRLDPSHEPWAMHRNPANPASLWQADPSTAAMMAFANQFACLWGALGSAGFFTYSAFTWLPQICTSSFLGSEAFFNPSDSDFILADPGWLRAPIPQNFKSRREAAKSWHFCQS